MNPKIVIIGLDGVPFTLLRDLKKRDKIPNIDSIFDTGYFGQMAVSIPEISSVSWSSFMTGTQSGEHGIFGFVDLTPGGYKMYFPNFSDLRTRTIFDDLGAIGKRSVVINLPSTYPAREINGVLISGFVAIDLNKAVFPYSLHEELRRIGYTIDVDMTRGREDHEFLLQELDETLDTRQKLAEILWDREDWDLFMLVITGTDRINHFLWNTWIDTSHHLHPDFIAYYQKVDKLIGLFYSKFMDLPGSRDGQNHLVLLSDHGFTDIRSEVYLNCWLKEHGFLVFKKEPPNSWEDVGPESQAFGMDPSRIYIHDKERYPNGSVTKGDVEKIKSDIRSGLKELSFDDGSPVLRKILDREEVFSGPFTDRGPDLVLLSHHGFDLKGRINSKSIFGLSGLKGMHTQDDAFFFANTGERVESIFEIKELLFKTFQ
jgi:predicted AlkP superfamily phosphohydrolase/phosphomutase